MMAKIRSGQGFAGLVDYANDIKNKETNIIASDGVDLTSNKSIVASFSLQAKIRPLEKARQFDPLGHAGFDPLDKIILTL